MKLIICRTDGCSNEGVGILWDYDTKIAEAQREGYTLAMPVCGGCNQTITDITDAAQGQVDAALAAAGVVDPAGGMLPVPADQQPDQPAADATESAPEQESDQEPVSDTTSDPSTDPAVTATDQPSTGDPTA